MMPELSLNILDITNNSIRAEATFIVIKITINTNSDLLSVFIQDNGNGMSNELLQKVEDPFFTTRTTRSVGLGVPFFKLAALSTNGSFSIKSNPGTGTTISATFGLSHIDRMPLGDITSTMHTLITLNQTIDFLYTYQYNTKSFTLDTREFREILDNIPFSNKEVSSYIKEYLEDNKIDVDGGIYI